MHPASLLLPLLVLASGTSEGPSGLAERIAFCTAAGPIELELDGDEVAGTYRIVVPHKDVQGRMSLRWADGYFAGEWIDEDGRGPIVIVLHDDGEGMTALYTRHDRPTSWEAPWIGWKPGTRFTDDASDCPPDPPDSPQG